jgi:hypothetical protein
VRAICKEDVIECEVCCAPAYLRCLYKGGVAYLNRESETKPYYTAIGINGSTNSAREPPRYFILVERLLTQSKASRFENSSARRTLLFDPVGYRVSGMFSPSVTSLLYCTSSQSFEYPSVTVSSACPSQKRKEGTRWRLTGNLETPIRRAASDLSG